MNLKKYAPYAFPLVVFLLVFFLIFRWFQLRSERANNELNFSEGIQIENLSEDEQNSILRGAGDYDTVALAPETNEDNEDSMMKPEATGLIRYEMMDGKVRFSVIVTADENATYSVWLHDTDTNELSPAFDLVAGKGGWVGTAAINAELLPVEVVVSTSSDKMRVLDNVVLRGMLNPVLEETQE
ncbi:MAG: hypothetical protein GW946_02775 [Candidatus Pacebacteria bacterium]|nr:hypothetical protein [Candidatus Paceibacterota bacterium]PIR59875.1 MAG: hypothetical protein COU67_04415 [Candidatus Pacebacteria bacterium CG10_big_fil_rev_8_21_14_0_10_44_54]